MFPGTYELYGVDPSFFTRKLQAVLRYKKIAHGYLPKGPENAKQLEARAGTHLVPILRTPENWVLWDSTPIAFLLDDRFPDTPIVPRTPVQRIACLVLEDWVDEWFTRPALHYRWCFADDRAFASQRIARGFAGLATEGPLDDSQRAAVAAAQEAILGWGSGATSVLGCGESQGEEVRGSFERVLDLLSAHAARHPALLGDRPCLADFAWLGGFEAHFGSDPTPRALLASRAPLVDAASRRLWEATSGAETWLADDEVPDTLLPLLAECASGFHAYLRANHAALGRGERRLSIDLGYGATEIAARPYTERCRQAVADEIARLSPEGRQRVRSRLAPTGALEVYELPPARRPR